MPKESFTKAERAAIENAIGRAEQKTNGEIQVHIENHCKKDVLDRAAEVFATLKMHKTSERNGVLFYLALQDHKFAILGDSGINKVVPDNFWEEAKTLTLKWCKAGDIAKGLQEGILLAGKQLSAHFPKSDDNTNELSNDISFGK